MLKEKIQALKALLGGDDELVQAVLAMAEQTEKEAEAAGIEFKGDDPQPEQPEPVAEKAEETEGEAESAEPEEEAEYENVIGDLTPEEFSGMMADALSKALEPYTKELKALKADRPRRMTNPPPCEKRWNSRPRPSRRSRCDWMNWKAHNPALPTKGIEQARPKKR